MTWLRFETDAPQSDVVGHLAEALGVPPAHAFGCYVACCLAFGAHRPDGRADQITDTTLELWAVWTGKRGRFAAAFRARCVDEDGVVRGWWRQEKLIARQRDKNRRRNNLPTDEGEKTGTKPAQNRHIFRTKPAQESAGNDTIRNGTVVNSSHHTADKPDFPVPDGLTPEGAEALTGMLRASPAPEALLAEVRAILGGMRPNTPTDPKLVSQALVDLRLAGATRPTGKQLRAFVLGAKRETEPVPEREPSHRGAPRGRRPDQPPPPDAVPRFVDPYRDRVGGLTQSLADLVPGVLAKVAPPEEAA